MIKLNPFSRTVFDLRFFSMDNMSRNQLQAFLISIPESSNTFGFEWYITKDKKQLTLFSHSPLVLSEHHIDRPDYQIITEKISCISIYPDKSSIYPFNVDADNVLALMDEAIKENELIILQLVLQKRSVEHWKDELMNQYRDYLQGIETPTSNKVLKFIQYQLLELAKKIDPMMNNPRIPEAEDKLNLDGFRYCLRAIVQSETEESRKRLFRDLRYALSKMNGLNKWIVSEEKKTESFYKMFFNRIFPTIHSMYQILSIRELMPLIAFEEKFEPVAESQTNTETRVEEQTVTEVKTETSLFSHMERGKKKSHEVDINFAQKLNSALRKLGLLKDKDTVIQNIQHGATVQKITFSLPEGLKLSELQRAQNDLQVELALNNIAFEQGEIPGTATMVIPQNEREAIFLRDCAETDEFMEFSKKAILPLLFGVDSNGKVVYECLSRVKHLLICGSTGSGKSVFLNTILLILLILKSPKELQMIMIDPKRVELRGFKDYPHVIDVYTDMDDAIGALCYAVETMEDRYALLEKKGYKNIQQYNKNELEPLPYLVVVIDELADLIMTHPEAEDFIVRLAQKARAAGIHLIIATQKPIGDVVTSLIKGNIYSRVCFACDSGVSYRVALDEVPKFTLLGKGDGVYRFEGIQGLHRFQGALIASDEDQQDAIIKKYSNYWKGNYKKNVIDMTALRAKAIEKEINDFKKIVLETGETRITELQKILNVRTERVKALMEKLIDEGWVIKHKSRAKGYELVLPEEERRSFLGK
jgi:S-DNA-T family DNA segregation ATPase FtsK/SpoIIIE